MVRVYVLGFCLTLMLGLLEQWWKPKMREKWLQLLLVAALWPIVLVGCVGAFFWVLWRDRAEWMQHIRAWRALRRLKRSTRRRKQTAADLDLVRREMSRIRGGQP